MTERLLSFEAINLQENVNRWYNVRLGQDLFGAWYILTSWGRKGYKGGQKKEYVFSVFDEAKKQALFICRKRLKATSRIGCNYICTNHALTLENLENMIG